MDRRYHGLQITPEEFADQLARYLTPGKDERAKRWNKKNSSLTICGRLSPIYSAKSRLWVRAEFRINLSAKM